MDVDDAIRVIGGFGFAQKKVFIVIGLYQVIAACHILQMSFIGEDPGWSCHGSRTVIDASEKCHYYDIGNCSPEYNREFTSIVTEVCATPTSCTTFSVYATTHNYRNDVPKMKENCMLESSSV